VCTVQYDELYSDGAITDEEQAKQSARMAGVVVYSMPNCAQCGLTYRVMDSKGIEYTIVDLSANKAAVEYVTEDLGYSQAPVIVASDKNHWSGFRPSYPRWGSELERTERFRSRAASRNTTAVQNAAGSS
jgi:glutaredoxin-like protein NrdH